MVLNLVQVVATRTDSLRLLEEAYEARRGTEGDRAIVLDSVLAAARAKGFGGSLELAAGVLQVSGRFLVTRGPVGQLQAIRQSTALVPIVAEAKRNALVPVAENRSSRALVPIAVG